MDLIARKYTILVDQEPLDIWVKNGQVKKAYFMDQRVALNFSKHLIEMIKDNPTRVVNGKNFEKNKEFTNAVSQMLHQKLQLAINKNDKKTLSRFARSNLVPENMKDNFIEAINRQKGVRAMLIKATNKTNLLFQNLARKIDRFFDKVNDRIANQKLDKYLQEYQLKEFNKAPPKKDLNLNRRFDPKLHDKAENFVKNLSEQNYFDIQVENTQGKILQNKFLQSAIRDGVSIIDAKSVLLQTIENQFSKQMDEQMYQTAGELQRAWLNVSNQLYAKELRENGKNETIEDFKKITKDMSNMQKIDFLVENKEYQNMTPTQKEEFENKYIFAQEPILERAKETKEIAKELRETTKEMSKEELHERVENISSQKSFESLKNEKGEIDPDKLIEYSKKLESIGIALKETANQKSVTREDLRKADRACEQQQSQGVQRERA